MSTGAPHKVEVPQINAPVKVAGAPTTSVAGVRHKPYQTLAHAGSSDIGLSDSPLDNVGSVVVVQKVSRQSSFGAARQYRSPGVRVQRLSSIDSTNAALSETVPVNAFDVATSQTKATFPAPPLQGAVLSPSLLSAQPSAAYGAAATCRNDPAALSGTRGSLSMNCSGIMQDHTGNCGHHAAADSPSFRQPPCSTAALPRCGNFWMNESGLQGTPSSTGTSLLQMSSGSLSQSQQEQQQQARRQPSLGASHFGTEATTGALLTASPSDQGRQLESSVNVVIRVRRHSMPSAVPLNHNATCEGHGSAFARVQRASSMTASVLSTQAHPERVNDSRQLSMGGGQPQGSAWQDSGAAVLSSQTSIGPESAPHPSPQRRSTIPSAFNPQLSLEGSQAWSSTGPKVATPLQLRGWHFPHQFSVGETSFSTSTRSNVSPQMSMDALAMAGAPMPGVSAHCVPCRAQTSFLLRQPQPQPPPQLAQMPPHPMLQESQGRQQTLHATPDLSPDDDIKWRFVESPQAEATLEVPGAVPCEGETASTDLSTAGATSTNKPQTAAAKQGGDGLRAKERHTLSTVHQDKFANHYKTKECRNYKTPGGCSFGDRCRYAHGPAEKRSYAVNQRQGLTTVAALHDFMQLGGRVASTSPTQQPSSTEGGG